MWQCEDKELDGNFKEEDCFKRGLSFEHFKKQRSAEQLARG